jgi:hypothetical protein
MEEIELCKVIFKAITNVEFDNTNNLHSSIVEEMAKCHKNMKNNEGIASISISGISTTYNTFYPFYIIKMLDRVRKRVRFL